MNLDIQEVIEAGRRWAELQREAEEYRLRVRLEDVIKDPQAVRRAWGLLVGDVPLRGTFPDGKSVRVDDPLTPRQVMLLANDRYVPVDPLSEEYQRILREVREELGRREPTRCHGQTNLGNECRLWALPYAEEPFCHHHCSPGDRERNRIMRDREQRRVVELVDELDAL